MISGDAAVVVVVFKNALFRHFKQHSWGNIWLYYTREKDLAAVASCRSGNLHRHNPDG